MALDTYLQACGEMSAYGKLALLGDLGIALAYFTIPVSLFLVWSRKLDEIPYPWMLILFGCSS